MYVQPDSFHYEVHIFIAARKSCFNGSSDKLWRPWQGWILCGSFHQFGSWAAVAVVIAPQCLCSNVLFVVIKERSKTVFSWSKATIWTFAAQRVGD